MSNLSITSKFCKSNHLYQIKPLKITLFLAKGQIKSKAGLACCRFSQETNKCEMQKKHTNKFICLFFERIYGAPICFWFYLTFKADALLIIVSACLRLHILRVRELKKKHNFLSLHGADNNFWKKNTLWKCWKKVAYIQRSNSKYFYRHFSWCYIWRILYRYRKWTSLKHIR